MGPARREDRGGGTWFDVRTWRLADVLALLLLVFNLGVTLTRVNVLEQTTAALERRIDGLAERVQALSERIARIEGRRP